MNHRRLRILLSLASHLLTGCSFTASVVPKTPDVSRVTVTTVSLTSNSGAIDAD